ncbi:hypothetical protein [Kutzneria chonburiensis]|uniref:PspA domain-containing protein n=1 Tax=Kutzneria chonburiensis TaxID=1483604 RepID=A0ABV6MRF7_9PSEU|nr:hypothetical protein [Kutzneria chonburiensis]
MDEDRHDVVDGEIVDDAPSTAVAVPSTPEPTLPEPDYSDGGVPSFDFVRDKIENRYTTSVGSTELAGLGTENTAEALDKQLADREQAAKDRLAEIRRSLGQ